LYGVGKMHWQGGLRGEKRKTVPQKGCRARGEWPTPNGGRGGHKTLKEKLSKKSNVKKPPAQGVFFGTPMELQLGDEKFLRSPGKKGLGLRHSVGIITKKKGTVDESSGEKLLTSGKVTKKKKGTTLYLSTGRIRKTLRREKLRGLFGGKAG